VPSRPSCEAEECAPAMLRIGPASRTVSTVEATSRARPGPGKAAPATAAITTRTSRNRSRTSAGHASRGCRPRCCSVSCTAPPFPITAQSRAGQAQSAVSTLFPRLGLDAGQEMPACWMR
jgi:hypothetical protein